MLGKFYSHRGMADAHASYLIRVLGELDAQWLDYFEDISIIVLNESDRTRVSVVCVHDSDQAAVFGVLNSLYQYGYPLVSLQLLSVA